MKMKIFHAINPAGGYEYTMCGLAFDAHGTGDAVDEIHLVNYNETVTCLDCRRVVLEVRRIRLGRLPRKSK